MKNVISDFLKIVTLCVIMMNAAHAEHDQGQGKSNHPDQLDSVSVAPEPSAFWLFLTGALMMTAVGLRKKKPHNGPPS
jgi:hypothetical protein